MLYCVCRCLAIAVQILIVKLNIWKLSHFYRKPANKMAGKEFLDRITINILIKFINYFYF